jgi:transposase InsO family protein
MKRFSIEKMCSVLKVSRSGYYSWLCSEPSNRAMENADLTVRIRKIHAKSRNTYGSPRIAKELRAQGIPASRPRVARLMRCAGLRSIVARKYRVATTDSKHGFHVADNLLDRDFRTGIIGRAWVSDLTYIRTTEGWLYLTTVIDLADRTVIGWALSDNMTAQDTSVAAWKMAVRNRAVAKDLIFHSDRGVQYACNDFTKLLKACTNVRQSMSRKGNCWDNAVAESFFRTLKSECTDHLNKLNRKQTGIAVFEYIECWYNTHRRHSALNYLTPLEYNNFLQTWKTAA